MVFLRPAASALHDFQIHAAAHNVPRCEVLGCGRVALHEALALAIDEVAAFAAGALGDENLDSGCEGVGTGESKRWSHVRLRRRCQTDGTGRIPCLGEGGLLARPWRCRRRYLCVRLWR